MERRVPDYQVQVRRLSELVGSWGKAVRTERFEGEWPFDLSRRGEGSTSVVVGEEVGAELGRPDTPSYAMVLTTFDRDIVEDGSVRCVGPDLDRATPDRGLPFAQVVILALEKGASPDPWELEADQYLTNRVQGYMARTVPGRLWVRIGRDLIDRGFRLATLGSVLLASYKMDFPGIVGAEALLVTRDNERVRSMDSIFAEHRVISGRNKKLELAENGVYECLDLDCEECDEKPVCDALKDVTIRYRKGKRSKDG